MPSVLIPAPVLRLASSPDIITYIASTQTVTHDAIIGRALHASSGSAPVPVEEPPAIDIKPDEPQTKKSKSKSKAKSKSKPTTETLSDLKSKSIRLVATGYVPFGKPLGGEQSVEPVVAVITEDKWVRLIQAETGKVFYER
jgi:hypothetical protein